jgi:hypothetical protein
VRRVERLQHLDKVEDLPQGVRAKFLLSNLRIGRKLRRSRPSNSSKDKCREVVVEIRGSVAGWRASNESRGETLLYFVESSRENGRTKSFGGDFTRFREPLDLPEVQGSYSAGVERIQSSGGAAPLIQVGQGRWIVHEIAYRDLVRKVS